MLVIYDSTGKTYFQGTGYPDPTGLLSYMNIDVQEGKYLDSIDTSKDPHEPVFKEYPPTQLDIFEEENTQQQADIDYLMLLMEV